MPIRLEDGQDLIESGLETAGELSEHAQKGVKRFWNGFSEFALSENVLQVAIGLMYELNLDVSNVPLFIDFESQN
jgi:hypothetical protein